MKVELTIDDTDVHIPVPSDRCVIGRNADCDVRLPDAAVSNHHAELITSNSRCFLEDLHSTNGTYINKRKVMRAELRDGDVIQLGRQRLTVHMDAKAERQHDGPDSNEVAADEKSQHRLSAPRSGSSVDLFVDSARRTSIVRAVARSSISDETERAVAQLEQSVRKRQTRNGEVPVAVLRLLTGKEPVRSVLLDRPTIELSSGRRCIAFLSRRPSGYYFIPASENDATRVNGIASQPPGRALYHRDVIDVAGIAMEFSFPDADPDKTKPESETQSETELPVEAVSAAVQA